MFRKILFIFLLALASCGSDTEAEESVVASFSPEITSFSIVEYPDADIVIDNDSNTIFITLPLGSVLGEVTVIFTLSESATASPESGSVIDLSQSQSIYLSTPSGHARRYTIDARLEPSPECMLDALYCDNHYVEAAATGKSFHFDLPYGSDLTSIVLEATISENATIEPDLSGPVDLTESLTLTVTAEDGVNKEHYEVSASLLEQETGVRGVYLPSPSHTSSFLTYNNVCSSIELLDELNFNCLFVCVWAQTKTAWDSELLLENSTYSSARAGNMYSSYSGGSGDALRDIIDVAHAKDIRVVFWFEYGFMHATSGVNTDDPLLAVHPDWIGINSTGGYSNYNGTDYYLNAYNPEVQEFLLGLMEEAVEKYPDVDGVQGDDRLPAMPRNSGYDEVTKALYLADTGSEPPSDYNDSDWVEWRLGVLNNFAKTMWARIKAIDSSLLVCFAPNKYPWCENNLMQDWPQWLADGVVDLLTVQFYTTATYENDILSALDYVQENTDKNVLNPAMILKNGDAILMEKLLLEELWYNRSVGTCGETQFWFDGLHEDYVYNVFKGIYAGKAIFPLN